MVARIPVNNEDKLSTSTGEFTGFLVAINGVCCGTQLPVDVLEHVG